MTNSELKSRLDKSIEFLRTELNQIRTSRATPALIEDIEADAYGAKMKIKELGSISILDSQNLVVSAWDRTLLPVIAKAIRDSEAKLNPVAEPDRVRVPVPPLTEERRKEFTKVVSTKIEDCKTVMRGIRQEAMKDIDADFAAKKMGEDDKFKFKEDVEKILKESELNPSCLELELTEGIIMKNS
jgi:ribosome recycling factor